MLLINLRPGGGGNPSPNNFFFTYVGRAADSLNSPALPLPPGRGREEHNAESKTTTA